MPHLLGLIRTGVNTGKYQKFKGFGLVSQMPAMLALNAWLL